MSVYQNINGTLARMDASDLVQLAAVDTEGILGGAPGATTNGQTLVDQLAEDDVQAQTDIRTLQSDKAEASTIAVIESASTSSAAYSAGDYIYHANALYRVTAPISIGDTFTVGTNIETATVCDEISDIKTDLPNLFPRSEQRVQGAKNHLRNEAYTQTIGVVTFTVDADGIIDVDTNGQTTTAAVSIRIYNESSAPELPQGDWILNGCPTGGGSTTYEIYYMERDSAGTGWENVCRDYGDGVSFSRQNDRAYAVVLQIRSGQTFNHLKFKPMIRLSTDTDPTFAPFAMTNRELTEEKCDNSVIAPVENGATASQAYSIGQHFIRDGAFCTAKAAIASGANFTLNTNYIVGNIGNNVDNILQAIAGQYADNGIDANAINSITQYINGWAPNTNMPSELNNGIGIMFTIATGDYGAIALQTKSSVNKNQLLLATTGFWRRSYTASTNTWGSWTKYSI